MLSEYPPPFTAWPKIPRWSREVIITEKIDGTNASILVPEDPALPLVAGSRTRWLSLLQDNYGFARWVTDNETELRKLGPGHHFGEWWGLGINRSYGLRERRFSLFNTQKWGNENARERPACCSVVPIISRYTHDLPYGFSTCVDAAMSELLVKGSVAQPGFMNPEGIVIFHTAARQMFKKTFDHDEKGKEAA